jgi:hypothetical protein
MMRLARDDLFESASLKWGMAVLNGHVLEASINEWVHHPDRERPRVQIAQYYDAKKHCVIFEAGSFENPFPVMWGLPLGDVVHGYRCALDHIAWALYKRGNSPPLSKRKERKILLPDYRSMSGLPLAIGPGRPTASRACSCESSQSHLKVSA